MFVLSNRGGGAGGCAGVAPSPERWDRSCSAEAMSLPTNAEVANTAPHAEHRNDGTRRSPGSGVLAPQDVQLTPLAVTRADYTKRAGLVLANPRGQSVFMEVEIMGRALFRSFVLAAFPCILATMAGCGGAAHPPATPTTTSADASKAGSAAPDATPKDSSSAPANDTAKASKTSDGSDIVPPFSSSPTPAGKSGKSGKKGTKAQK